MKRSIIIISILLMGVLLSYSQNLTITSPHRGDNWEQYRTYIITWTQRGSLNANVKIRLYNSAGTVKIHDISNSRLTTSERIRWTVPGSIRDGHYIIRVKTLNNLVSDDSDVFAIGPPSSEAVLTVVTTINRSIPPLRNPELPDLVITKIGPLRYSRSEDGQRGSQLTISVKNKGTLTSNPDHIGIKDYSAAIGVQSCRVTGYIIFNMPEIAPGETKTGYFYFPCELLYGITNSNRENYFFIEAFVNSSNSIVESNLTNNKRRFLGGDLIPILTSDPKPSSYRVRWR